MDFDGDGTQDVISGSWPGELSLFRGLGEGKFAAAETIKDKHDKPIKVGSASAVFAADWDGDGDLDLLIGNIEGQMHLAINEGIAKQYSYAAPQKMSAAGKPLLVGGDAGPAVADWDGDGKLDLIVGAGNGSVTWFRNEGSTTEPELAAGQLLLAANSRSETSSDKCGQRTKVCVTDYNDDGRLDLLVGDFSYVQEKPPELTAEQKAEREKAEKAYNEVMTRYREAMNKTRLPKLQQEYLKLRQAPDKETPEEETSRTETLEKLTEEMRIVQQEFMKENEAIFKELTEAREKLGTGNTAYHGYVWFLERLPAPATTAAR